MNINEKSVEVEVGLYSLEVIYKACYHFLEKFYVRLDGDSKETVRVYFRPKSGTPEKSMDEVLGDFQNELIHQALREKVSASNQKIREYIVTQALAAAEGVTPEMKGALSAAEGMDGGSPSSKDGSVSETSSPVLDEELEKEIEKLLAEVEKSSEADDPLKISAPWEEKNSSSAKNVAPVSETPKK